MNSCVLSKFVLNPSAFLQPYPMNSGSGTTKPSLVSVAFMFYFNSFVFRLDVLNHVLCKTFELSRLNFGNKTKAEGIHKAIQG